MTEDLGNGSARGGNLGLVIVVGLLMLVAFFLGKLMAQPTTHAAPPLEPFVEAPANKEMVVHQLEDAVKSGKWDHRAQQAFNRNLGPLSLESRKKLSLELVGLLNTGKIVMERPAAAPECSYVPGPCRLPANGATTDQPAAPP